MITETSLNQFNKINLEPLEQEVFRALDELGPVHDLRLQEYLQQRENQKPKRERRKWGINIVTARRMGLVNRGLANLAGIYRGQWNDKQTPYRFWRLVNDAREPAGWEKIPDEELKRMQNVAKKLRERRARNKVVKLKAAFTASDFGRALVNCRYEKQRQRPVETAQMALFS